MTIKKAIEIAIEEGMTTFSAAHYGYDGRCFEKSKEEFYDFIKYYENDTVLTLYLGNWHKKYNGQGKPYTYPRPTHCHIIYKLEDEDIPSVI